MNILTLPCSTYIFPYSCILPYSTKVEKNVAETFWKTGMRKNIRIFHIIYSCGNNKYFSSFMARSLQFHIHTFFHILQKCKTLLLKHCRKLNMEEYILYSFQLHIYGVIKKIVPHSTFLPKNVFLLHSTKVLNNASVATPSPYNFLVLIRTR